jgi:sigma-E factor negative regulatory protein RseA
LNVGSEVSLPEEGWEGSLEALSLLADGQASADQAGEALGLWARDASAQERWQTWHLVGDVLRSADLAPAHAQSDVFLSQLQARLREEPVPLAPPPPRRSAAWALQAGGAMKAVLGQYWPARGPLVAGGGVAALALVLVLGAGETWQGLRSSPAAPVTGSSASELAVAPQARAVTVAAAPPAASRTPGPEAWEASAAAAPVWQPADGRLIRDARLDEYLRAHRAGGPALPGGATGRFETVVLER